MFNRRKTKVKSDSAKLMTQEEFQALLDKSLAESCTELNQKISKVDIATKKLSESHYN